MTDGIALAVFTDGRVDCIRRTLASFDELVTGNITRRVIYDDSGDRTYYQWLRETWPTYDVVHRPTRLGFCGTIADAWDDLALGPEKFVYHLEDDFLHRRPVDLDRMAFLLEQRPDLVQIALLRQPVNETEIAAGGVIPSHRARGVPFTEARLLGMEWVEHRAFFTTNPSLYPSALCAQGWLRESECEGKFGIRVLADPDARFAFWGRGDEWVEHIGDTRVGTGY